MATKGDPYREIRWTDAAISDLKFRRITKQEWRVIRSEVERIAAMHYFSLDSAVCHIAQCPGWWRLKITRPAQLRIAFTLESGSPPRLIVQAVNRRTERTYDIFEIIWRKSKLA